jgi:hypothetical protein
MVENENFLKKEIEMKAIPSKTIVIDDTKFKSSKRPNINFSTNYLSIPEQLKLILNKHKLIYSRSIGVLLFMFLSPIFFLTLLQLLQTLNDRYNQFLIVKEHKEFDLNSISLKCEAEPCISVGISLLVILL